MARLRLLLCSALLLFASVVAFGTNPNWEDSCRALRDTLSRTISVKDGIIASRDTTIKHLNDSIAQLTASAEAEIDWQSYASDNWDGLASLLLQVVAIVLLLRLLKRRRKVKPKAEDEVRPEWSTKQDVEAVSEAVKASNAAIENLRAEMQKMQRNVAQPDMSRINSMVEGLCGELRKVRSQLSQPIPSPTPIVKTSPFSTKPAEPNSAPKMELIGYAEVAFEDTLTVGERTDSSIIEVYQKGDQFMFRLIQDATKLEQFNTMGDPLRRMRKNGFFDFGDDDLRGKIRCEGYGYLTLVEGTHNVFRPMSPLKLKNTVNG